MADTIQSYVRRPALYDNIDGTAEMGLGGMYLAFSLLGYLQSVLPKESMWSHGWWSMLLMYIVMLPAIMLWHWGTKLIKRHVTWPRTGYVKPRRPAAKKFVVFLTAVVVAAVAAYFFVRVSKGFTTELARQAMLASLVIPYAILAFNLTKDHPWKWLGIPFLISGLAVTAHFVPGGPNVLWLPASCFAGVTWLASGGITLYLYIRRTSPPGAEVE